MRGAAILAGLAAVGIVAGACTARRAHEEHTTKAGAFVRASTERTARGAPAVAVDRNGRIFVLDALNARIARVAGDDLVDVAEVPPDADDLAIGPDGPFAVHRSVKPEIPVPGPEGPEVGLRRPGMKSAGGQGKRPPMPFVCDTPASPIVQQDDDAVRITRWDSAPGAVTGWHSHGWPYFVIMLVAGTLRVHDGSKVTDVFLEAGQAYRRAAGVEHDVMNGSSHPIAFVEIEVKRPDLLAVPPSP